jgi:DnaJ family protein C protein 19
MATPFLTGLGVAGVAMGAKYALRAAEALKSNPEAVKQMGAAAAGFHGMRNAFRVPQVISQMFGGSAAGGFDATMTKREAALILGVSERSSKDQIKKAHRKIMMLNHPDRGGSPFVASKINEAAEVLQGTSSARTSAFQ